MAMIAFAVYGTLINTDAVVSQLREWIGPQAEEFSQTWRSKQLEYSFRRGLMRRYENFAVCTRQTLDYCCVEYDVSFSAEQKDALLQSFRALPAFSDADESLVALKAGGPCRRMNNTSWSRHGCGFSEWQERSPSTIDRMRWP